MTVGETKATPEKDGTRGRSGKTEEKNPNTSDSSACGESDEGGSGMPSDASTGDEVTETFDESCEEGTEGNESCDEAGDSPEEPDIEESKPDIEESEPDGATTVVDCATSDVAFAIESLRRDLADVALQVCNLQKLFEEKVLRSKHEEKIIDQMHRELQKYKGDMYSQLVRPILIDMIEIRDSILRVSSAHRVKPEEKRDIPLGTFEMYSYDVQETLEKNNIEIFSSEVNSDFVPVAQRVVKKKPTGDEKLHGKVAESIGDGYRYMGRTIVPERIAVYLYDPQLT